MLYLYVDRGRIVNGCFDLLLSGTQLRDAVADLREAGHGVERWIVPSLEFTHAQLSVSGSWSPELVQATREMLDSCKDLPIAEQWRKVRATPRRANTRGKRGRYRRG